jgi:hypothetical protein
VLCTGNYHELQEDKERKMFGFFKRNIGKERNVSAAGSAAPSQATLVPDPVAAPQVQISIDKVMDIVSKRWTSNASRNVSTTLRQWHLDFRLDFPPLSLVG